jgi:hypothetical protein
MSATLCRLTKPNKNHACGALVWEPATTLADLHPDLDKKFKLALMKPAIATYCTKCGYVFLVVLSEKEKD